MGSFLLAYQIWRGCPVRGVVSALAAAVVLIAEAARASARSAGSAARSRPRGSAASALFGGARCAASLALVDHEVDGHLALQTADVTVAEVIAEFVHLAKKMSNFRCASEYVECGHCVYIDVTVRSLNNGLCVRKANEMPTVSK